MSQPSFILKNDALARHQKAAIELIYDITAAKGGAFVAGRPQAIVGYDAGDFVQSAIDALLGSTNEVLATAFGSTAMGTDALGIILNCDGQIAAVHSVEIYAVAGTTKSSQLGLVAAPTNGSLATVARVSCTSLGNIALQCVVTDLDASTAGKLVIRILADLK